MKIKSLLSEKSNNYSALENIFYNKYNSDLIFDKVIDDTLIAKDISIIIPFNNNYNHLYKTILSINYQKNINSNNIEIIIVNDSRKQIPKNIFRDSNIKIKIINNKMNFGAGVSRNIGVIKSKYKFILFLDSGIVLNSDYLSQHYIRQSGFRNIITFSLIKNIPYDSNKISKSNIIKQNIYTKYFYSDDFRYKLDLNNLINNKLRIDKKINLLKYTNYLKDFGYYTFIYYWSLSNMVVTNNLFFEKKIFIKSGGFKDNFKFAQWEDTDLGSRLIISAYIIPILSTNVLHIKHNRKYNHKSTFLTNEKIYIKNMSCNYTTSNFKYLIKKYKKYIKSIDVL